MSRMGKKALSLVLVLLVSISMLPAQIFADDGFLQTENTTDGAGASEDWAGPEENSDRPENVFSVPEETPTAALTAADFCCKLEKITRIFLFHV